MRSGLFAHRLQCRIVRGCPSMRLELQLLLRLTPPQYAHYSDSQEGLDTILLALQHHWPHKWEDRVTVVPSDCSYECSDVRVYNQFTREWSSLGLDEFLYCRCFLNQGPLDKLEATGQTDPDFLS